MTLNLDHLKQIAQNAKPFVLYAGVAPASVSISADTLTVLIARIEELETTLQRVRDARSNHPEIPECDRYTDDDPIKCGWKSAVESIDKALEGDPQ